jgi:hypothetical protein
MKAAIYARYSSENQKESSIADQTETAKVMQLASVGTSRAGMRTAQLAVQLMNAPATSNVGRRQGA